MLLTKALFQQIKFNKFLQDQSLPDLHTFP